MISLTRLNGAPFVVNSDLIKSLEASPDTMLTLIHGEKIVVLESCDEVIERMTAYRVKVLARLAQDLPDAAARLSAHSAGEADMAREAYQEFKRQGIVPDLAAVHRRRSQD
jgi:flagellar protein FlbD